MSARGHEDVRWLLALLLREYGEGGEATFETTEYWTTCRAIDGREWAIWRNTGAVYVVTNGAVARRPDLDASMNHSELGELYEKIDRTAKTAATYVRKTETLLYHWLHVAPSRPMPSAYWMLVEQLLDTAHAIIEQLPADWFETTTERSFIDGTPFEFNHAEHVVGERLAKLAALYEERVKGAKLDVRIRALENTIGRTPEEAEAYLAKAAELRGRG